MQELGAVGGSFLAARTHGADSLGMFQNTSHAPGLNFKKLGHLHIQNASGLVEGGVGEKEKIPKAAHGRGEQYPQADVLLRRGVGCKG